MDQLPNELIYELFSEYGINPSNFSKTSTKYNMLLKELELPKEKILLGSRLRNEKIGVFSNFLTES